MVDLVAIAIVVLCALVGYLRGGLVGVLNLLALIVAFLVSAPVGPAVAGIIAARTQWPVVATYLAGRAMAFAFVYLLLTVPALILARRLGKTEWGEVRGWNRLLGGLSGLISGLVLAIVLLLLIDVVLKVMPEATSGPAEWARSSVLRRWASPHNPADRFLVTDVLKLLRAAKEDRSVLERLQRQEYVQQLIQHPDFRAVREDERLARAIDARNIDAILENENLRRLLANRELRTKALSAEMRQAIQQAMGAVGQPAP